MAGLPARTVTTLFTDIEGSTRLLQQLRDRYAQVLADYRRLLRAIVQEQGGQELDTRVQRPIRRPWGGFMGLSLPLWTKYVHWPWFKPEISLVAWDGPEIAGFGHFIINDEQNALTGKKQSLMRYIGVRARWRRIGLGVALTRAGLILSREHGMEACLSGVDSENVTGAHHIYEREGFITIKRHFMYRADVLARERAE